MRVRHDILESTKVVETIFQLCRRIVIIDHGKLLYDGTLEDLRHRLGRFNQMNVHLQDRHHASQLDQALEEGNGISWEHRDELTYRIRYNRELSSTAEIIRRIVNEVPVRDIYVEAEPIEDIIKTIYSRGIESGE